MCSTQRSKIKRETFERSTRRSEACNLAKLRYAEGVTSHLDSFWALKDNIFYSYYDFMTLKDICDFFWVMIPGTYIQRKL